MNRILLLIGASGSGKSTVARYLCEQYGLRQIDSYTTRPPRYRGESGHIFITDEEFDQLQDFVGYTLYNGHRYGATAQQVEENDIYVIDPAGVEGLTPNSLSHQIRKSVEALRNSGIIVSFRRSNGGRLICLKSADGVDDLAAKKIVTIDPVDRPAGGYAEGAR